MRRWLPWVLLLFLATGCGSRGVPAAAPARQEAGAAKATAAATNEQPTEPEDGMKVTPQVTEALPREPGVSEAWTWPDWARVARIAGAYFDPADTDAAIDARLAALAAQNVSVVLADSPWGQQYDVWADDDKFRPVRDLVARMVRLAHARGLKVVMYQTGLELLSGAQRNPGLEHPEWAQRMLDGGKPVLFNDVTTEEEHWLKQGIWDFWVTPCMGESAGSFRELSLRRVREMAGTGIDGLWVDEVYLQSSVGSHDDMWPSSDSCSAAAFQAATGLQIPATADWDDPVFGRWLVWRHDAITEFLLAEKAVARAVNPAIVFLNENSDLDTGRSTYVANDPAAYLAYPDMTTGHEVETVGDRMDEGETGMQAATLDQWLAFRTMIAFARGVDRGKPSWILTYGYKPRDSAQLAGLVLAEGANFYETKGPQMADTAGVSYRTSLFGWIAGHEAAWYASESAAQVGLLYSPRTRDLVDTTSGEPYDAGDSTHFAAYRQAANLLYRAHIPFDVVIDTDTARFGRYHVLVVPEVQAMSDATAAALRQYPGVLVTTGDTGLYDEWLEDRSADALAGVTSHHFAELNPASIALADTGLLATQAPPSVQIGLRRSEEAYSLVLVNTARHKTQAFPVSLRLAEGEDVAGVHFDILGGGQAAVPFTVFPDRSTVSFEVPAGIDTAGLLTLTIQRR